MKKKVALISLAIVLTAVIFSCARIQRWQTVHTPKDEACMHCHYGIYKNWKISYRPYNEALKEGDYRPVHSSPMSARDVEMTKSHKEGKGDCSKCHVLPRSQEQLTISKIGMSLEDTAYQLCGRCHKVTYDEWKWSSFRSRDISCLDCHTDAGEKALTEGKGYYHTKQGAMEVNRGITAPAIRLDRMKNAVSLSEEIVIVDSNISLSLIVTNKGAGHYLPTSSLDTALVASITMRDSSGRVVDKKDVIIAGRGKSSIPPGGDSFTSVDLAAPGKGSYKIELSLNHVDRVKGEEKPVMLQKKGIGVLVR